MTSYKFGSVDPISGNEYFDDNGQFVSSVCWRKKSNMLVAANSTGNMKLLKLVWQLGLFATTTGIGLFESETRTKQVWLWSKRFCPGNYDPIWPEEKKVRNLGEVEEAKLSVIIYYLILLPVILYIWDIIWDKLLRFFRNDSYLVGITCNDERYITCTSVVYR